MSQLITQQNNEIAENLKALIDTSSACYVLNEIVQIAYAKADHIRSNWNDLWEVNKERSYHQDDNLARQWEALANNLEALADKHVSL